MYITVQPTVIEIAAAYARRSEDILQNTPGGSVSYGKVCTSFVFGRASVLMAEACKGKKFALDEAEVDGEICLVFTEAKKGCKFTRHRGSSDSGADLEYKVQFRANREIVKEYLPTSELHPRSPKFAAFFVEGHGPKDPETIIAIKPAERTAI